MRILDREQKDTRAEEKMKLTSFLDFAGMCDGNMACSVLMDPSLGRTVQGPMFC